MNYSLIQPLPFRKIAIVLSGFLVVFLLLIPSSVSAADVDTKHELCSGANLAFVEGGAGCAQESDGSGGFKNSARDDQADSKVNKLVIDAINIISVIAGVAAVLMIIYGGFRFVTSGGNAESTRAARNAILYAIIGLVIIAFAQLIVKFVLSKAVGVVQT